MSTKDDLDHRKMMDWARPDIPAHGNVIGMLATTFELDPTFFDSDYLPTFLGLGAWEDTSWPIASPCNVPWRKPRQPLS